MSKLNDALKRASQSDRDRQRVIPPRVSKEPAAPPRGQSLALALGAGSVLALALAAWFFWQWWAAGRTPAPAPAHVEALPVVAPEPAPPPVLRQKMPPPPAMVASPPPAVAPAPAPTPAPVASAPATRVESAWPANLKVTGIFFRKTNPLALINGTTVSQGDEIDGIRVTKIESDRVTVEWNGQVKEIKVNAGGS